MRDLDALIDSALPSYAGEPAPGLAGRVLRRWSGRRFGFVWVAAAAAAVLVVFWSRPLVLAPPALVRASVAAPVVGVHPALKGWAASGGVRRATTALTRATGRVTGTRPRVVAGAGLTREERALLALARTHPELVERVFVEGQKRLSEPLQIAPIVIEPLAQPE